MGNHVEMFVQLVWGTYGRQDVIRSGIEEQLHAVIGAKCVSLGCRPIAIGGTGDHVHVLIELNPAVPVARVVAEAKGSSAHAMNHRLHPGAGFRWQEGYGAFTIATDDLKAVEDYVRDQKRHHAHGALEPTLESFAGA